MYLPFKTKRLEFECDIETLQNEVASIPEDWWLRHHFHDTFNDGIPLLSQNGTLKNPDGSDNHSLLPPFAPTERLKALPRTSEIVYGFGTSPSRTRYMRMDPGQIVQPHQDRNPHWNDKVRVHIPVFTDPAVTFHVWDLDGQLPSNAHHSIHMAAGEAWVFNTQFYHGVQSLFEEHRVHLVIDFELNGPMFDAVLGDCDQHELDATREYQYPQYIVDEPTLYWMSGGNTNAGRAFWHATVNDDSRQETKIRVDWNAANSPG